MGTNDWIPRPDADFNVWQENFYTTLTNLLGALSLPGNILDPVTAARTDWQAKYPAHLAGQIQAKALTTAKDGSRDEYNVALRAFVAFLQAWPALTDPMRTALGLPIHDKTKSNNQGITPPVQASAVIVSETLRHVIWFFEAGKKKGAAKPKGMKGCEIRRVILPADDPVPVDFALYTFLAIDTAAPYEVNYGSGDGGRTAHYIFRWISTADVPGPWNDPVSATIRKI